VASPNALFTSLGGSPDELCKPPIEFFATCHTGTVIIEACAGSHHMARKLAVFGHPVKLISSQFVKPFVKSNKNDFVDGRRESHRGVGAVPTTTSHRFAQAPYHRRSGLRKCGGP
jgi:transposase